MHDQGDSWARFAVIKYDNNIGKFVYSARRHDSTALSYICQLQQQGLFKLHTESMGGREKIRFIIVYV